MTLEQADIVMKEYGKFLEYVDYKFTPIFSMGKPESILPFPKQVIEEGLGIMLDRFRDIGDTKTANSIDACLVSLTSYISDEEALTEAAKRIGDPDYMHKFTIPLWKNAQSENLKRLA